MNTPRKLTKRQKLHIRLTKKAVRACDNSQTELARRIGGNTRQGHVYQWMHGLKPVSPETALAIELAVPGVVYREEFHPELYESMSRETETESAA